MGISSLPSPSEGILILLIANSASSLSLLKNAAVFLFDLVRLFRSHPADSEDDSDSNSPADRFRIRLKPTQFDSQDSSRRSADCRVCLCRFELESVVNRLPCGHLFHEACLYRWMDYHHYTCPLCRTRLLP